MKTPNGIVRDAGMVIGWLGAAIKDMGERRSWTFALSGKTDIVVAQTFPLYTSHESPDRLFGACKIAAQGSAVKASLVSIVAAVPIDTTVALGIIKSFGVRVKIANSPLNFKYGQYTVDLLDNATLLSTVVIKPATNVADIIILAINNNGGQATVVPVLQPVVTVRVATSSLSAGDAIVAETLNERDLGLLRP
jgi:hypothetical protein